MASRETVTQMVMVMRSAGLKWAPPLSTPGDIEITARTYHEMLSDAEAQDLQTALKDMMRTSREWVTPAELLERIRGMNRERTAKLPLQAGPPPTPEQRAKVLDAIKEIADHMRAKGAPELAAREVSLE